jgi:hypothetical protein
VEGLLCMTLCNLVTLITGISMSAVATNGQIKVPYLSRGGFWARRVFVRLNRNGFIDGQGLKRKCSSLLTIFKIFKKPDLEICEFYVFDLLSLVRIVENLKNGLLPFFHRQEYIE